MLQLDHSVRGLTFGDRDEGAVRALFANKDNLEPEEILALDIGDDDKLQALLCPDVLPAEILKHLTLDLAIILGELRDDRRVSDALGERSTLYEADTDLRPIPPHMVEALWQAHEETLGRAVEDQEDAASLMYQISKAAICACCDPVDAVSCSKAFARAFMVKSRMEPFDLPPDSPRGHCRHWRKAFKKVTDLDELGGIGWRDLERATAKDAAVQACPDSVELWAAVIARKLILVLIHEKLATVPCDPVVSSSV